MGIDSEDAIKQLQALVDAVEEPLKKTFEHIHQGFPIEAFIRFLKARDWDVAKAHKMLMDCLNWRIQNEIDNILAKPIVPVNFYRGVRDTQLVGLSGYSKEGLPVFAVGVGQSTYDKASVHYYVQSHIQINEYRDRIILPFVTKKYGRYIGTCIKVLDMTGLKLSALGQIKPMFRFFMLEIENENVESSSIKLEGDFILTMNDTVANWVLVNFIELLTALSTIDDLNYPEKTDTYYIVNVPYIFSACWKVVKPLLQERTRRKVQLLQGCGRDELLKVMDYASLPHFCRRKGSGSSRYSADEIDDCFSLGHSFHQQLYNYIKEQSLELDPVGPLKQSSFHVDYPDPDPEDKIIAQTIQCELKRLGHQNGLSRTFSGLKTEQ